MYGTDVVIPGNLIFFLKYFSQKFFGNWCFSGSYLEIPAVNSEPGHFYDSVLTRSEAIKVNGNIQESNTGDINYISQIWGEKTWRMVCMMEKEFPYQSLSFTEKLRHAGSFCRSREWLDKYKLTVYKQVMANYPYFCEYVLSSFKMYCCSWEFVPMSITF